MSQKSLRISAKCRIQKNAINFKIRYKKVLLAVKKQLAKFKNQGLSMSQYMND